MFGRTPKWANDLSKQISASQAAILQALKQQGEKIMAAGNNAIQTAVAAAEANFQATKAQLTTIQAGVTALDAKITALQAQLAAGGSTLSAPDQAALDQLVADSAALKTQAEAIDTMAPAGS